MIKDDKIVKALKALKSSKWFHSGALVEIQG